MQLPIFSALFKFALGSPIGATGASVSRGFISGNVIQLPANISLNICGNTVSVIGLLNPAFVNSCTNESSDLTSAAATEDNTDPTDAASHDNTTTA